MKKFLLFTVFAALAAAASAQSFRVLNGETVLKEGDVVYFSEFQDITETLKMAEGKLVVENLTSAPIEISAECTTIEVPEDVNMQFCYGGDGILGNCWADGTGTAEAPVGAILEWQMHYIGAAGGKYNVKTSLPDGSEAINVTVVFDEKDAVRSIDSASDSAPEYFTLQGVKVNSPEKGIYIVRRAGKISKEIVR